MSVQKLPQEIISHILSYLDVLDRGDASLVCQTWYYASRDPRLLQNTQIVVQGGEVPLVRQFAHWRSPNVVLDHVNAAVLEEVGQFLSPHLLCLDLRGASVTERMFVSLASQCCQLQTLDLSGCNSLFMSGELLSKHPDILAVRAGLQHLVGLKLDSIRHLTDATLNRLLTVCPALTSLSLVSAPLNFSSTWSGPRRSVVASSAVLSFGNLLTSVVTLAAQLRGLDLSKTSVSDDALEAVVTVDGLVLQDLRLCNCQDLSPEGLRDLAKHQTGLTSLALAGCPGLTDAALKALLLANTGLTKLEVSKCRSLSDGSVAYLSHLPSLASLEVAECHQLTTRGLTKGLCGGGASLRHVCVRGCGVTDAFTVALVKAAPNVTHLDLGLCLSISDVSVLAIAAHLGSLATLRLDWCRLVTDSGLLGLGPADVTHEPGCRCVRGGDTTPHLKTRAEVSVSGPPPAPVTDDDQAMQPGVSCLAQLRHLDLTACVRVTDAALTRGASSVALRRVALTLCPLVTDAGVRALVKHSPGLEHVSLSQCPRVTDGALSSLAQLRRLRSLDVSGCDAVTDIGLKPLTRAKRLRELDVSMTRVTSAGTRALEDALPALASLHTRFLA